MTIQRWQKRTGEMGVLARTWVWTLSGRALLCHLLSHLPLASVSALHPSLRLSFQASLATNAACHLITALQTTPLSTLTWGRGLNYPLGKEETEISYPRNSPSPTPPGCGRDPAASRVLPSPTRKSSSCRRRFCGCKIGEGASDDLHNKELTGGGRT